MFVSSYLGPWDSHQGEFVIICVSYRFFSEHLVGGREEVYVEGILMFLKHSHKK